MQLKATVPAMMAILLCGCDATSIYDQAMYRQERQDIKISPEPGRFEIHRVDLFTDNTAYNNTRGVYVIKDTRTGKEYFGVAGIGISELNAPATGPAQRHDEK